MIGPRALCRINTVRRALGSVRTSIALLFLLGATVATASFVLQRTENNPEKLASVYSLSTLRWLDRLALTDMFHSWWFVALLTLLGVNLIFASMERFPVAWRYFRRPYSRPDAHYQASLALQREIVISSSESGLEAAEATFRQLGFRPPQVAKPDGRSLYTEKNRFSRLAAYIVYASLLVIFAGAAIDAVWGYRGFIELTQGQQVHHIQLPGGARRELPFALRCDGAGQQNHADGLPRRWRSTLAVLEDGHEVKSKEIAVNDPLVYRGVRFDQSSYRSTQGINAVDLRARLKSDLDRPRDMVLRPNQSLALDENTSVRLAAFFPDFVLRGRQVESRSNDLNNPAIQLTVESRLPPGTGPAGSRTATVWLFPRFPTFAHTDSSPYAFEVRNVQAGYITRLEVLHEPGQCVVWAGVLLLGAGLVAGLYFNHVRIWAVPVSDDRGRLVLWVGALASRNREAFRARFEKLVLQIEQRLPSGRRGPEQELVTPGLGANTQGTVNRWHPQRQ